jgi:hypothetical protein
VKFFGNPDRAGHARAAAHTDGRVHPTEADIRAAYDQGRREERRRHRSHPILGLAVAVLAIVGAALLGLAAMTGSFSNGGHVADRQLAEAANQAAPAVRNAADAAGQAVHEAGSDIRSRTDQAG